MTWLETSAFSSFEFITMTSFPSSQLLDLAFLTSFTEVLRLENNLEIECSNPILRDDFFGVESLFCGAHSCLVQKASTDVQNY